MLSLQCSRVQILYSSSYFLFTNPLFFASSSAKTHDAHLLHPRTLCSLFTFNFYIRLNPRPFLAYPFPEPVVACNLLFSASVIPVISPSKAAVTFFFTTFHPRRSVAPKSPIRTVYIDLIVNFNSRSKNSSLTIVVGRCEGINMDDLEGIVEILSKGKYTN